ncbi:recombinase RecT [Bosea massiliensis]|uniref:Recombinase RecT n=1 Tax=Bosea massiliensis TaxID=151419 RepID=A0ABW0PCR7_9HYPH
MSAATELTVSPHAGKTPMNLLEVSRHAGGVAYANMADTIATAELMSRSGIAVRAHLRGEPGACHAVVMQAIAWDMNPYQVANKSYSVNNQIAYEAQLIQAVIQMRAPIKGRIKTEYTGEGGKRQLRVWALTRPGDDEEPETVEYKSPEFDRIQPKNSPLWKNDPDQQLHYYAVRAWCRRHFPEVILGVYAPDEIEAVKGVDYHEIDARDTMAEKLDRIAAPKKERQPRAAAQTAPAVTAPLPAHDPDTGEIKPETAAPAPKPKGYDALFAAASLVIEDGVMTKSGDAVDVGQQAGAGDIEDADLVIEKGIITKNLVRAPDAAPKEPVKVTSGTAAPEKKADAPRDPVADERATQQEMAAAAGALEPGNDPFADDDRSAEQEDPLKAKVEAFKRDLAAVTDEPGLEKCRKSFMKDFKSVPNDNPFYKEAALAYQQTLARVKDGAPAQPAKTETAPEAKPAPAPAAQQQPDMSPEDEAELERIMMHELDHAPRGIDTNDLGQVKAYVQGLKAAAKGRAIGAVPAVYSDVEAEAWKVGHAYRAANPATSQA